MRNLHVALFLLLSACHLPFEMEDYYDGTGQPPQVQGISQTREEGNVGGDIVSIYGRSLGGDTKSVTVIFGSQNAEVVAADGQSVKIRVPQGPIQGGRVEVSVGTMGGQAKVPGGYTYDIGDLVKDQAGYVLLQNGWESCRLGLAYTNSALPEDACDGWASQGQTGITTRATFLEAAFPNMHSMYQGWGGSSDQTGTWKLQSPAQSVNSFDQENAYKDLLRDDVRGLQVVNLAWDDSDAPEEQYWCADLHNLATYTFNGGRDGDEIYGATSIDPSGGIESWLSLMDEADVERCLESDGNRLVDMRTLDFCETHEADNPATRVFQADWLPGEPFFFGMNEEGDWDKMAESHVQVKIPDLRVSEELVLPPPAAFSGTQGFDVQTFDPAIFTLVGPLTCEDTNEDGDFTLDEAAFRIEWPPFEGELTPNEGNVKGSQVRVRVTFSMFDIGWLGGSSMPIRATVTVPDFNNFDEETGRSFVDMPSWLIYQFPTVNLSWGTTQSLGGSSTYTWGDPESNDTAYFIVTVDRITEYTLNVDDLAGDLVVAYVTSDEGIFDWNNPLDSGTTCTDCVDSDGDGWVDGRDPDCARGGEENNATFGDYTCNDGVDNDGDGLVDSEDTDCAYGTDTESPECGDFQDNDEDGWIDEEDPDCLNGALEDNHNYGRYGCNDGEDNDGDGWADREDPGCTDALQDELDGYSSYQCNDGIDNDGHGDVDREDLLCLFEGAKHPVEQQDPMEGDCINELDDDLDGYIDGNDPDCEYTPWGFERSKFKDPETNEGIRQCYNGIDDDGDGCVDAADPGCIRPDGVPDGFLNDESVSDPSDGLCEGEDSDTGLDTGR